MRKIQTLQSGFMIVQFTQIIILIIIASLVDMITFQQKNQLHLKILIAHGNVQTVVAINLILKQ